MMRISTGLMMGAMALGLATMLHAGAPAKPEKATPAAGKMPKLEMPTSVTCTKGEQVVLSWAPVEGAVAYDYTLVAGDQEYADTVDAPETTASVPLAEVSTDSATPVQAQLRAMQLTDRAKGASKWVKQDCADSAPAATPR